jgi:hypothetical protein
MYYTDSRVSIAHKFILNTKTMSAAQLLSAGLKSSDSEDASDHLPIAADISQVSFPVQFSSFSAQ